MQLRNSCKIELLRTPMVIFSKNLKLKKNVLETQGWLLTTINQRESYSRANLHKHLPKSIAARCFIELNYPLYTNIFSIICSWTLHFELWHEVGRNTSKYWMNQSDSPTTWNISALVIISTTNDIIYHEWDYYLKEYPYT